MKGFQKVSILCLSVYCQKKRISLFRVSLRKERGIRSLSTIVLVVMTDQDHSIVPDLIVTGPGPGTGGIKIGIEARKETGLLTGTGLDVTIAITKATLSRTAFAVWLRRREDTKTDIDVCPVKYFDVCPVKYFVIIFRW